MRLVRRDYLSQNGNSFEKEPSFYYLLLLLEHLIFDFTPILLQFFFK